jgi:hypothetical protein
MKIEGTMVVAIAAALGKTEALTNNRLSFAV